MSVAESSEAGSLLAHCNEEINPVWIGLQVLHSPPFFFFLQLTATSKIWPFPALPLRLLITQLRQDQRNPPLKVAA